MPLQLLPVEDADFRRAVDLERLAFGSSPYNPILFPGPFPPDTAEKRAQELIIQRKEDSTTRCLKIVDSSLKGDEAIIAFAKWHIYDPKPAASIKPREFGPGCNVEACALLFGGMAQRREKLIGDRHYVCAFIIPMCCLAGMLIERDQDLRMLVTDPAHQRRGAGEMLTRWGIEEAKKLRLPAFVESSEAAHRLYMKCGFLDVDIYTVDMWKWGAENPHTTYLMISDQWL
jgi:GNAT superfamily N-acetyltransferase